jgi:hypothetical protein
MRRLAFPVILAFALGLGLGGVTGFVGAAEISPRIVVNGLPLQLRSGDTPPAIIGGRVLVPLRAVAEMFGAKIEWDQATTTAYIVTVSPAVAALGEAITVEGVTATISSVVYDADGAPSITFALTNHTTKEVLGGMYGRLRYTLSDSTYETLFNRIGPFVACSKNGNNILPGETAEITYSYNKLWPGVKITSITYSCVLIDAAGFTSLLPVGVWAVPTV